MKKSYILIVSQKRKKANVLPDFLIIPLYFKSFDVFEIKKEIIELSIISLSLQFN